MVERVWGGNRLHRLHGKNIPAGKVIGESWELADRADAQSVIAHGPFKGRTLRELLADQAEAVLGPALAAARPKWFPLLIKYVDAGEALSVQVHPDDAGAKALNDRGKSECWVVVHVEPGAKVTRGLSPGVTRADYEKAVASGQVESVLRSFTPKPGDVLAIPPGMIHAIGAGLVVAEIQQNSDVTFRIHDYNRMGLDGKPRKLHVAEALSAIRFEGSGDEFSGDMKSDTAAPHSSERRGALHLEHLLDGRFFSLERHTLSAGGQYSLRANPAAPRVLMAVSGSGMLQGQALNVGQTVLLPADLPDVSISAGAEGLVTLISTPTVAACG